MNVVDSGSFTNKYEAKTTDLTMTFCFEQERTDKERLQLENRMWNVTLKFQRRMTWDSIILCRVMTNTPRNMMTGMRHNR